MEAARHLDGPPIGQNIRLARRLARDMTQGHLSRCSGIDQAALSGYENGHHIPTWERLVEIARCTGISDPGWFYTDHSDTWASLNVDAE